MSMFQRMFGGRRKSPVQDEGNPSTGIEATEERPDVVNSDGFIILDDGTSQSSSSVFDPPPGYTLGGANAFLPYGLDPQRTPSGTLQRTESLDPQTAIDGIPFKLGSKILLEGSIQQVDLSTSAQMIQKINTFNWDEYEYSFQLERSVLQEFNTSEQEFSAIEHEQEFSAVEQEFLNTSEQEQTSE